MKRGGAMKRLMCYFLLLSLLLAGCATTGSLQRKEDVADFSIKSYPNAEIREFKTSEGLENYQGYSSKVGHVLMQYLPLERIFNKVSYYDDTSDSEGVLVIEATLLRLKSVSRGARLMLGIMAGRSGIEMEVVLRDKATGKVLSKNVILVQSSLSLGAFSATDRETINHMAREIIVYLNNLK